MAELDDKKKKKKEGEEGEGEGKTQEGKGQEGGSSAGTQSTGEGEPGPIPYDRFKQVNDRAKQLAAKLEELETAQSKRDSEDETKRQARLKEQEKFEELATEWETKFNEIQPQHVASIKELQEVSAILETYADAELELVPETFRDVVKKLPLKDRLEWLTENKDKLSEGTKTGGIPATPKGTGKSDLSDEDRRKRSVRTF